MFKHVKTLVAILLPLLFFGLIWNPVLATNIESKTVDMLESTDDSTYLSPLEVTTQLGNHAVSTPTLYEDQLFVNSNLILIDSRIIAMRQFLTDRQSPMYPYAEVFVKEADKYGLDWRLVASISGVESNFGNLIPWGSFNAWGWKGDPTRDWSHFTSWTQGIKVVTERMALGYGTHLTPFDIEATYCPPCGLNPEHAWANGVTRFMNELSSYEQGL